MHLSALSRSGSRSGLDCTTAPLHPPLVLPPWSRAPTLSPAYTQDSLHVLDVSPGGLLHHSLLWPGLEPLRTIQESDLGLRVCDLTYLPAWRQLYVTM